MEVQIPLSEAEGELGKILPIVDPQLISRLAEARDLKYGVLSLGAKTMQK